MEIPVVITRTEYERLLDMQKSFAVLEKRLQAAEARIPVPPKIYSGYELGQEVREEGEQRIKIRTKDGFVSISDKAFPKSHTRVRTACTINRGMVLDAIGSEPIKIEYRNYEFVGICRKTGLRMFEEF